MSLETMVSMIIMEPPDLSAMMVMMMMVMMMMVMMRMRMMMVMMRSLLTCQP